MPEPKHEDNTKHSPLNQGLDAIAIGVINIGEGIFNFARAMTSASSQDQATQNPSISSFRDLTHAEVETLQRKYPAYATCVQKYTEALIKTHKILLDNKLISSAKLAELEKNYINLFTHQLNETKDIDYNQSGYYTQALKDALLFNIKTKHKSSRKTKETVNKNEIDTSLAYLWKACNKKNDDSLSKFLQDMSDAHGLIQVTGWSTQNENSLFAFIDCYNYQRYKNDIAEARFILVSLITPFYPLFTEYQDIARREKNIFIKVLRTAIPMLIIAGFIITAAALMPVALPELAFFILAIPLLYLGLALASLYVKTKELIYRGYRDMMYAGDINLFPEFLVNDDLKDVFGEQACEIREYYIQALQACESIEAQYKSKNLLEDDAEEAKRTENLERNHALLLEWFDLRDNKKLNRKNKVLIALKRLEADEVSLYKSFELNIKALTQALADDLTAIYYAEDAEDKFQKHYTASSSRFFPSCSKQYDEISKLQKLEKAVEARLN